MRTSSALADCRANSPVNLTTRPMRLAAGIRKRTKRLARRWFPRRQVEWSIGIYLGSSPFQFAPPPNVANPVLTRADVRDVDAAFVADPFMLLVGRTWYMFFEILNRDTEKGEIGLATSEDGLVWMYRHVVLSEPFSVSYPYVFDWRGEYYMIPESRRAGAIRLYRAVEFPMRWACVATLLEDGFVDSSVFHYDGRWWLFAETNPEIKHDTLRLFYAPDLPGPWREHHRSPIVWRNPRMARPAGRVLIVDGRIIRYAQDCYPTYSKAVRAFEVTDLTVTDYQERELVPSPILGPGEAPWNQSGMHHIDPHLTEDDRWIACVDGKGIRPVQVVR